MASPLNPQGKITAKDSLPAKAIACRKFTKPFFIDKKPVSCDQTSGCQPRLVTHICEATKASLCDKQALWQSVPQLMNLPADAEITAITEQPDALNNAKKVLICWHYR